MREPRISGLDPVELLRNAGSDHDLHGVSPSSPMPYDTSALRWLHEAVTHDTAQL
ncbi:hypothetical protein [Streptomyces sviceus]|uniref:hypothetical protein n=1 Tax=Streptomyces sviceus TaxID=285530 RepID=UPI0036E9B8C8